ncbi:MAG: signal recognition particle subunit SRP19/SEC65 family protein [Candidatus Geothermarchaeales archaeon]
MKIKNAYIFWTVYFDSTLTRKEGRRLPTKLCVPEPGLEELVRATEEARLKTIAKKVVKFPRMWWKRAGYVAVEKKGRKRDIMMEISRNLRKNRSVRGEGGRGKLAR